MENEKERPTLITIIAIIYFIGGAMFLLFSAWVFVDGVTAGTLNDTGIAVGVVGAVAGAICFAIGTGFWKGWRFIWYLAVIIGTIGCFVGLMMIAGNDLSAIIGLIIQAPLLYYIYRPDVKKFFGV